LCFVVVDVEVGDHAIVSGRWKGDK
jgi:hypothetical protein